VVVVVEMGWAQVRAIENEMCLAERRVLLSASIYANFTAVGAALLLAVPNWDWTCRV
jgi:hypothetical protein